MIEANVAKSNREEGSKPNCGEVICATDVISHRAVMILSGILFKAVLDASYVFYLSPAFETHFLTPFVIDFSAVQFAESYFWTLVVLLYLPTSSRSASGLALLCAFVFLHAPVATIYGLDAARSRDTILLTTIALASTYIASSAKIGRRAKIRLPAEGKIPMLAVCFLFSLLFITICIISGAIFRMNFNADRIYDFRSLRASEIDIGVFAYTNLWTQKIFTPLILAVGLHKKSIGLVSFALCMHLVYFGVTQHRSHLFTPLLVLLAYQIYRHEFTYGSTLLALSVSLSVLLAIVAVFDLQNFAAVVVRRALFVGASVTYNWVEFFLYNPKIHFSDNLLSGFIESRYSGVNIPRFMGDHLRPEAQLAFNSGLVGAGYAQLGTMGVAIYGALLGLVARFGNRLIDAGVPPYIHAAILFLPYRIAWADADFPTALLSHGLLVGSVVIWAYGRHSAAVSNAPQPNARRLSERNAKSGGECTA